MKNRPGRRAGRQVGGRASRQMHGWAHVWVAEPCVGWRKCHAVRAAVCALACGLRRTPAGRSSHPGCLQQAGRAGLAAWHGTRQAHPGRLSALHAAQAQLQLWCLARLAGLCVLRLPGWGVLLPGWPPTRVDAHALIRGDQQPPHAAQAEVPHLLISLLALQRARQGQAERVVGRGGGGLCAAGERVCPTGGRLGVRPARARGARAHCWLRTSGDRAMLRSRSVPSHLLTSFCLHRKEGASHGHPAMPLQARQPDSRPSPTPAPASR